MDRYLNKMKVRFLRRLKVGKSRYFFSVIFGKKHKRQKSIKPMIIHREGTEEIFI